MKKLINALIMMLLAWGVIAQPAFAAPNLSAAPVAAYVSTPTVQAISANADQALPSVPRSAEQLVAALNDRLPYSGGQSHDLTRGPPASSLLIADLFPSGMGRLSQSLRNFFVPSTSIQLPKFAAAIARVKAGTGRGLIGDIGDSTTAGWGGKLAVGPYATSDNAGTTDADKVGSRSHYLAAAWAAAGVPSRSDGWLGNGNIPIANVGNSDLTLGTGWALLSSVSIGGYGYQASGSVTTSMVFTPEFSTNSFDIYFVSGSGFGTFTVTDASGTLATINTSAASAFSKVTVTRAASSTSPISIQRNGTGTYVTIFGIIPFDTASPRLEIVNMGWGGATAASFLQTGNPWSPATALPTLTNFDAFTIALGVNEKNGGVATATYQANLQSLASIVHGISTAPDVLLMVEHKSSVPGTTGYYLSSDYVAVPGTVSTNLGLSAPIDLFDNTTLLTGDYYDAIHLAQQGYNKLAVYERGQLAAKAGVP